MALPVCSSFLRVLPNYMRVVYQWEVFVAEGLCTIPGWVRLSTCAWAPAPAIAGGLHRWSGGYGYATEAHRSVVTAIGAVDLDWPSQAAEAFGGAS